MGDQRQGGIAWTDNAKLGDKAGIAWTDKLAARFWSYVDKRGPDECWPWIAGTFSNGYGQFRFGHRKVKAHRVAYELVVGQLGKLNGCHACDNPPCCNPSHVFPGTSLDNARDRDAKGRGSRLGHSLPGVLNPAAKLTRDEVERIRVARIAGETLRDIAITHGISPSQVRNIVTRTSWR